jgi:outer membrane receptor protein involved in Fe transport
MRSHYNLKTGVALACFLTFGTALSASPAFAQAAAQPSAPIEAPETDEPQEAQVIIVRGQITYRNRSTETEPTLVYGQDYFQRFEPLTAGDALKRVPSVTFLSDVLESDGVRLRGLDPGYTQIQINGEPVPGSNADRSFFMDRIPAELIDRVEIVRSASARRQGDAMAGTLNIVLRDGFALKGGYIRAGGLRFDDGEFKPSLGLVWGGTMGPGKILISATVQGRYSPKVKGSLRYSDSPENDPSFTTNAFENREDQTDTRDGTDYGLNLAWDAELSEDTEVKLSAFYVMTNREQDERSYEYNSATGVSGPVRTSTGTLLTDNANLDTIDQNNWQLRGNVEHEWALGETTVKLSLAQFKDERYETEDEVDFDRTTPRYTGDLTQSDIQDVEVSVNLDHEFEFGNDLELVAGLFWQKKTRDTDIREDRNRFNLTAADRIWDQFSNTPVKFRTAWDPAVAPPGGLSKIEETRVDVFALLEGDSGALSWEAGVRYETTQVDIDDRTVNNGKNSRDLTAFLPSAHLRYELTENDRLSASVARTVRRPQFDFITPALLEAELGDNDLLGNPSLDLETAWGLDVGYERRLGRKGVAGLNAFWRDVTDLVELTNTGVQGSEGSGTFVLQPRNSGSGTVWGVELDLSTPLTALALDNTGVFFNFSWLDSEITDAFGVRKFNSQSDTVFNVGFIQDLPSLNSSFGVTYRKQGDAFSRIVGEEVTTSYGADLEVFLEHRIGGNFMIRFVGSNLLNASKDEVFNKFTTIGDQTSRDFDEYELETEEAGPVFQLIGRYAF